MKSDFQGKRALLVVSLLALLLLPQTVLADFLLTSGDACNIQNFGGDAAKNGSRKQGGGYYNISAGLNFTVSCPLMIDHQFNNYSVLVRFNNLDASTQNFICKLDEYDNANFRIRSVTKNTDIPSNFSSAIFFDDIQLATYGNRLYMVCNLPPHSSMGFLGTESRPS